MMQIIYLVIQVLSLVGLISGILMFWLVIEPDKEKNTHSHPYVSIIIPARDEAQRLPWLLESIRSQNWHHYEIIVVDDESTDQTSEVASHFGAHVYRSQPVGTMSPGKAKDRKSTRLNSSHVAISYAVFCLKKKKRPATPRDSRRRHQT